MTGSTKLLAKWSGHSQCIGGDPFYFSCWWTCNVNNIGKVAIIPPHIPDLWRELTASFLTTERLLYLDQGFVHAGPHPAKSNLMQVKQEKFSDRKTLDLVYTGSHTKKTNS